MLGRPDAEPTYLSQHRRFLFRFCLDSALLPLLAPTRAEDLEGLHVVFQLHERVSTMHRGNAGTLRGHVKQEGW